MFHFFKKKDNKFILGAPARRRCWEKEWRSFRQKAGSALRQTEKWEWCLIPSTQSASLQISAPKS